ncbi:oxidoreductase [Cyanobium sp. NIES-981]|uniref:NADH-quinone oxidoreductase subunit B family protein n=1 Tax=Cyanobium sp. NIES-981 TaxID=1851505 RepID=UPI0007DCFE05|nr:oxidoreductase [Cyanobium sp. NIES-981]SBO43414.1 F420-non reducing hydrogenase, subunit gamma [Cyanobium sp. NIES-981]
MTTPAPKLRFATVWLAGCSGCHMSFLDLDEWLFELARHVDVVFSPVASDVKTYPEAVDVCLVEGAVANADNLELAQQLRQRTRLVVAFGDCAVTGNVPALRNLWAGVDGGSRQSVLDRGYVELADTGAQHPHAPGIVPELLERVLPLHEVIPVDLYLPGCPPSADRIREAITPLLRGETPVMEGAAMLKFG